jgi:hypothetical protein
LSISSIYSSISVIYSSIFIIYSSISVIYAISGAKLYEGAIPAGITTINTRLPKGVCIVAFGDGTRRKV